MVAVTLVVRLGMVLSLVKLTKTVMFGLGKALFGAILRESQFEIIV